MVDPAPVSHDHHVMVNGEDLMLDANDIEQQLEKEQRDYLEQSRLLSEKLSALQNEMEDFKQEEAMNPINRRGMVRDIPIGEKLHASLVRQSSHKQTAYDKV